jgi:hypothetical protein
MSQNNHTSIQHRISFDHEASSPTAVTEGPQKGYFNDQLTRDLLGLKKEEVLLNSGTYGAKEPGHHPVEFALLCQGDFEKRLLPFVPQGQAYGFSNLVFYSQNGQYYLKADSLRLVRDLLQQTMTRALQAANSASLSLPAYSHALVPKFFFRASSDAHLFPYQFQPFFTPPALRAQWVRISRVIALLGGFINLCSQIAGGRSDWNQGTPVGIHVEGKLVNKDDKKLARAFQLLGIPLEGTYEPQDVAGYSIQDVRDALLGRQDGKSTIIPTFEFVDELTSDDDDALDYSVIVPDYNYTNYATDGVRLTNIERCNEETKMLKVPHPVRVPHMPCYPTKLTPCLRILPTRVNLMLLGPRCRQSTSLRS